MQLKTIPEDFIVVEIAKHEVKREGNYALVEMTKRNISTEKALSAIAESLKIQRKFLGYAGAKDARAVTKQYITIKLEDQSLVERIKKFKRDNIALRFLGYKSEQISLGNLEKNKFEIVIRNIAEEKLHPLHNIPNYFDEQRFSQANAQIGKLIVKGDFKAAAEKLMETDDEAEARLRRHLEEKLNDYVGALKLMPKNILLMYVHAYQSLLFNEVLSRYITEKDKNAILVEGPVNIYVPTKELSSLPFANSSSSKNELSAIDIPIFGFGTEDDPVFGKWYEEILEREGLESRDFVIRSIPFLTVEGGSRAGFFQIENLEVGKLEEDNLNPGAKKQRLTFTLPKSCYATMVVKVLYRVGRVQGQ